MEKIRLDKYLSKVLGVSRSQVAHLIEKKMVLVNGVVAEKNGVWVEESDRVEILDSANSQNLIKNNPRASANLETRPLRGAKNRIQASSSASADFLLEADKRGSPPKSEKAAAFWRVGGAGRGVQPFLREKTSEISSNGIAESSTESQGGLPRRFCESARNDEFLDSSLRLRSAQNDKIGAENDENSVRVAESSLDSADSQNLPQIERIYEDNDILVLNKPPFLATHGAPSLKEPSLVEWLKAHKIQRSTISGELREGIVHRLDKQTSGALVVAKNNAAHQALSAQLADKTMTRLYLAIIDLPLKEDIEIECFLARNPKNRLKISKVDVRKIRRNAESTAKNPSLRADSQNLRGNPPCDSAILSQGGWLLRNARNDEFATDSQNLPKFARYSKSKFFKLLPSKDGKKELILARLFTGRTHQIRAHLESINRHIVGDELYGYKRGKGENYRVMLHAYLLQLVHPKDFITQNSAESALDSADSQNLQGGLPRRFCESARNDEILDSSLRLRSAQNDNMGAWNDKIKQSQNDNLMGFAESNADSATRTKSAESNEKNKSKKPIKSFCYFWLLPKVESTLPLNHNLPNNADSANLRFIAPLFDDMKDYLAKNFDMEKVNEILRTLPTRAF